MKLSEITGFIDRIYLDGQVDTIKVKSAEKTLKSTFVSQERNLIGTVELKNFTAFEDAEIGLYNIAVFQKLLAILDEDITMKLYSEKSIPRSIECYDKQRTINFALTELAIIPTAATLKSEPTFEIQIPITKEFHNDFLKARAALPEVMKFAVTFDKNLGQNLADISFGETNVNTNRISFQAVGTSTIDYSDSDLTFSASYLKSILAANKGMKGTIYVSTKGMMKVSFSNSEFNCVYYLIQIK